MLGRSGGFSVLEQAAVLIVLCVMVFGAADIMHLLHAYSTMQAGVQETLRCATSIDSCRIAENKAPTRQYRVYRFEHDQSDHYVNTFNYRAISSWIRFYSYGYQTFAVVPDQVHIEYETQNYTAIKSLYPVIATPAYFVRTSGLPHIHGSSADDVSITYPKDRNKNFPATVNQDLSKVRLVAADNAPSTLQQTVEFEIGRPFPASDRPCYVSRNEGGAPNITHNAAFGRSCADSWPWKDGQEFFNAHPTALQTNTFNKPKDSQEIDKFTYVVIQILGTSGGSADAKGGLEVLVAPKPENSNSNPKWRKLNGRVISRTSSGNLLPRGAHPANYSGQIKDDYENREIEYHQAIKVPYDRKILVRFLINKESGNLLRWTGDRLKIFAPRYQFVTNSFYCDNQATKLELNSAQIRCQSKVPPAAIVDIRADTHNQNSDTPTIAIGCQASQDIALGQLAKRVTDPLNYDLQFSSDSACKRGKTTYRCPEAGERADVHSSPNYGIDSCGPESASLIQSICPAPEQLRPLIEVGQISCSEREVTVTSQSDPNWLFTPASCLDVASEQAKLFAIRKSMPSDLQQFKKLNFKNETLIPSSFSDHYPGGETSPDDENQASFERYREEADYNCIEAKLAQIALFKGALTLTVAGKDVETNTLPAGSPFSSKQVDLGCNWRGTLKDAAFSHGVANGTHLQIPAPEKTSELKKIDLEKIDSCMNYQTNRPNNAKKILIGTFNENQIPKEYQGSEYSKEFVGFIGAAPASPKLDQELALHVGQRLIRTFFPRANFGCRDGGYCASIELTQTDHQLRAEASMRVPLMLFFKRPFALSYNQSRTEEIAFR